MFIRSGFMSDYSFAPTQIEQAGSMFYSNSLTIRNQDRILGYAGLMNFVRSSIPLPLFSMR